MLYLDFVHADRYVFLHTLRGGTCLLDLEAPAGVSARYYDGIFTRGMIAGDLPLFRVCKKGFDGVDIFYKLNDGGELKEFPVPAIWPDSIFGMFKHFIIGRNARDPDNELSVWSISSGEKERILLAPSSLHRPTRSRLLFPNAEMRFDRIEPDGDGNADNPSVFAAYCLAEESLFD